jgi:hypothetical protein
LEDARAIAERIKAKFPFKNVFDKRIFYGSRDDLEKMLESFRMRSSDSSYSAENERVYSQYQEILANLLKMQVERGVYTDLINPLQPVEKVSDETQKVLNRTLINGLDLSYIDFVVGLGGLSECGKSGIGKYLMEKRGIVFSSQQYEC